MKSKRISHYCFFLVPALNRVQFRQFRRYAFKIHSERIEYIFGYEKFRTRAHADTRLQQKSHKYNVYVDKERSKYSLFVVKKRFLTELTSSTVCNFVIAVTVWKLHNRCYFVFLLSHFCLSHDRKYAFSHQIGNVYLFNYNIIYILRAVRFSRTQNTIQYNKMRNRWLRFGFVSFQHLI